MFLNYRKNKEIKQKEKMEGKAKDVEIKKREKKEEASGQQLKTDALDRKVVA